MRNTWCELTTVSDILIDELQGKLPAEDIKQAPKLSLPSLLYLGSDG